MQWHPRNPRIFEEYDLDKMKKAKRLLIEVYEYYYGAPGMASKVKRLETIISKIETLQNMK